jgi:hypothetical protein
MQLDSLIERTQTVRDALPMPHIKQRLAAAAQALSRAGDEQARVELLNEALLSLVSVLYVTDADQRPANIDAQTWRLLIPAPWGRAGWKRWGLRYWEGEVLRRIMLVRAQQRRPATLFDFNEVARTWHLSLADYPTVNTAFAYLRAQPVTLAEWHRHADIYRRQANERMYASRGQRRTNSRTNPARKGA